MSDEKKEKVCRWECAHWAADMDSEYCAHPKAIKHSVFGINLDRARGAQLYKPNTPAEDPAWNLCGPEGKLWEPRPEDRKPR